MIALACDNYAAGMKNEIIKLLEEMGLTYKDFGTYTEESCAYPVFAARAARAVAAGECDRGIVICGTGIGMSMAANKHKGIRAAACENTFSARMTRMHNNANVLCLGERVVGYGLACDMVDLFIDTPFEGGRHQARVDDINALDQK